MFRAHDARKCTTSLKERTCFGAQLAAAAESLAISPSLLQWFIGGCEQKHQKTPFLSTDGLSGKKPGIRKGDYSLPSIIKLREIQGSLVDNDLYHSKEVSESLLNSA